MLGEFDFLCYLSVNSFFILPWIVVITCSKIHENRDIFIFTFSVRLVEKFKPLSNSQNMPSVKITQLIHCCAYVFYLPIFGFVWTVMAELTKLDHNWWSIRKSNHNSEKKINNPRLDFSFPPFIALLKLKTAICKNRRYGSG